jgi:hypothetical protein
VRVRLKPQDQAASAGPQPIQDVARVFAVIYLQEALKDLRQLCCAAVPAMLRPPKTVTLSQENRGR